MSAPRNYVAEHFARYPSTEEPRPLMRAANGRGLSVQASKFHYCSPRKDDPGPLGYSCVEVYGWYGWSARPPAFLRAYGARASNPAGWVPVAKVNAWIDRNGGPSW